MLKRGFLEKKKEINEYLEKLKLLCPDLFNKYSNYWKFIKSNPVENIDLLIKSLFMLNAIFL